MADLKISQLPVASATTGAELFPVVQGGVTKQIALNAVRHIGSAVFDANGSMAVDTNTLFVDAVNNRVGVGTASPASTLDVVGGNISIASGNVFYLSGAGGNAYLQESSGTVFVGAGGAGRVQVNSSGNFGLGVTPSAASARTLQFPDGVTISNAGTAASFAHNAVFNSGWKYVATGTATLYQKYLGAHAWFTAPSGTAGNAISFTQAMTLNASGNLGVGTASPGVALDVQNASTTQIRALMTGVGGAEMRMLADTGSGVVGTYSNHSLAIKTNTTTVATFDTSGNLLIGIASAATSSAKTLHLANATVPTANPSGGGVLYVEAGALKYRGSSGTVTTIANA